MPIALLVIAGISLLPAAFAVNTVVVTPAVNAKSTALEASRVLKNKAGNLVSIHVYNSNVAAQFILIIDSATVPVNGSVNLLFPPIRVPAQTTISYPFTVPLHASLGISVCNSSTGPSKTLGAADCFFVAQVQ